MRSIHGPTAATSIAGSGRPIGPGDQALGNSDIFVKRPSKLNGSPRNPAKQARTACT
ncbi:unannotated protein [freshwater metagenome]|uniref:Unannotated protein n=1 Tax=freshwater metagenome TaxID=449393 RepID=A0A6J6QG77_9ZZZZ